MKQDDCMEALELFGFANGFDYDDTALVKRKTKNSENPELDTLGVSIGTIVNHHKEQVDNLIEKYTEELNDFLDYHGYENFNGFIKRKGK